MHKKINTLITRVLLLGSFSSFLVLSNVHAAISNASDSVIHAVPAAPTSYSPPPPAGNTTKRPGPCAASSRGSTASE